MIHWHTCARTSLLPSSELIVDFCYSPDLVEVGRRRSLSISVFRNYDSCIVGTPQAYIKFTVYWAYHMII